MNNKSFNRFLKNEALALEPFCFIKNIIEGIVSSLGLGLIKYKIMNGTRAKREYKPIVEAMPNAIYTIPLFLKKNKLN